MRLPGWLETRIRARGFEGQLVVDETVSIVGDIHGRADLLSRLLPRLEGRPVFVGDYIDRGEGSAQVLDLVRGLPDAICLMGNHEAMCLDFLDDPETGGLWLRNGGLQTLASYGVSGPQPGRGREMAEVAVELRQAMGDTLVAWLRNRPTSWRTGSLLATHAGAVPLVAPEDQLERHLLWGAPGFYETARKDGLWVAHGHVIVDEPAARDGRIAVDTGAFAAGRLSAAIVQAGPTALPVRFVSAGDSDLLAGGRD